MNRIFIPPFTHCLGYLHRLAGTPEVAGRAAAEADIVEEGGVFVPKAVERIVIVARRQLRPAPLAHELALGYPLERAGRVEAVPDRQAQEEQVILEMEGGALEDGAGGGQEAQMGGPAGSQGAVQEKVGDGGGVEGDLLVVEGDLRIVTAGQEAHGVDAVDGGGGEIGIGPAHPGELVLDMLDGSKNCSGGKACSGEDAVTIDSSGEAVAINLGEEAVAIDSGENSFQGSYQGSGAPVEGYLVRRPALLRRPDHRVGFGDSQARRLFHQERVAHVQDAAGEGGCVLGRNVQADGVGFFRSQHFQVVGVGAAEAEAPGVIRCFLPIQIAAGAQPGIRLVGGVTGVGRAVVAGGDAAASDDANFEGKARFSILLFSSLDDLRHLCGNYGQQEQGQHPKPVSQCEESGIEDRIQDRHVDNCQ